MGAKAQGGFKREGQNQWGLRSERLAPRARVAGRESPSLLLLRLAVGNNRSSNRI